MPTLRATSISSFSSTVNVTMPSTSLGLQSGVVDRGLDCLAGQLHLAAAGLLRELGLADPDDRGLAAETAHASTPSSRLSTAVPVT